ncbi:armadillo-type protein [Tribonema minus]|uniref:Armadillo-type protein n=1 Tax=Tribonema minus TaxID=303371 RepID=A0A836CAF2_9STRA|nr:armadillo-type protein [Tribonema minus]
MNDLLKRVSKLLGEPVVVDAEGHTAATAEDLAALCWYVADQDPDEELARTAFPHVIAALRAYPKDEEVQKWGYGALAEIAHADKTIEGLADAPPLVLDALQSHDEACVEAAFHAVARLAQAHVAIQTSLGELGACEHVPDALRLSGHAIKAYGCMAVEALAAGSAVHQKKLGDRGSCPLIVDALKDGNVDVERQACLALAALASGCKANHSKLSKGLPSLMEILAKRHHDEYAWLAVSALADNARNQRELGDQDICGMAMRTADAASATARQRALEVMANLAALPCNSKKLGDLGAFRLAVKLARQEPTDEDRQAWSVMLLRNLAENGGNREAMGRDLDLCALLGEQLSRDPAGVAEDYRDNLNSVVRSLATVDANVQRLAFVCGERERRQQVTQERDDAIADGHARLAVQQAAVAKLAEVQQELREAEAREGELAQQAAADRAAAAEVTAVREELQRERQEAQVREGAAAELVEVREELQRERQEAQAAAAQLAAAQQTAATELAEVREELQQAREAEQQAAAAQLAAAQQTAATELAEVREAAAAQLAAAQQTAATELAEVREELQQAREAEQQAAAAQLATAQQTAATELAEVREELQQARDVEQQARKLADVRSQLVDSLRHEMAQAREAATNGQRELIVQQAKFVGQELGQLRREIGGLQGKITELKEAKEGLQGVIGEREREVEGLQVVVNKMRTERKQEKERVSRLADEFSERLLGIKRPRTDP